MMIRLGQTNKGHMIIASDQPFPSKVKRVEYYRDQKLFTFCFEDESQEDQLAEYEVSDAVSELIKTSPDVIIVAMAGEENKKDEYLCPLIQVGT